MDEIIHKSVHTWQVYLLESVTRIGLHIDHVIMCLCNEEDKDNKIYLWYACFVGFMRFLL